ncbi:unnamed protein product [Mytilus coruscus]|uniref:Uncharacterized protein n=1 Tax=Mytilus coruscus TaxID=42192 RepID=A0A6J8AQQ6_MYTCO|nr:unnamed protein product [Mytilus coruscus]
MLKLIVLSIVFTTVFKAFEACDQGWQQFENSCYFASSSGGNSMPELVARTKHWFDAKETCLKEEKCVICQNSISHEDTVVVLGEKGSQSVNKASKSRQDNVVTSAGQKLHQNCRKSYTNPKYIALANKEIKHETTNVPKLRSKVEFDFKKHCLFCGQLADAVIGRKRKSDVYPVRTSEFQCKIEDICKQRKNEWALEVRGRLEFIQDLHAANALYHQTCSVNFQTLKQTPLAFSPPAKKAKTQAGRKSSLSESFLFAAKYLQQNEDEQITVTDLVKKMSELCGIDDAYGVQPMKNKLQEHFGDRIIISEINGKQNVVTFRNTVWSILHEFYEQTNTNRSIDEEKKSIIQAAAKILNLKSFLQKHPPSPRHYILHLMNYLHKIT